jgi:hypothetical protein
MKLNELPVSIQKQINETYENHDEILTKIKKKISENEFILDINSEETLCYNCGTIDEVFYDKNNDPFIEKYNRKIFLFDCDFYHFSFYNFVKIYLLKDNDNNFYFCKEYYKFDKSTKNLTLKKEYFYEKLTKENVNKYIEPQLSLADFSLLNEYFNVDSDNELIDNNTLLYLYEEEQKNPLFSEKLKKYNLSNYINSDYDVKIANRIIDKIDNNQNFEKLLDPYYNELNDLYNNINYIEELINKNIISFKN